MRVYQTCGGATLTKEIVEKGYRWARTHMLFTNEELDCLRLIADPLLGAEKLRGDEVAEEEKPIWRKLATLGLVMVDEQVDASPQISGREGARPE